LNIENNKKNRSLSQIDRLRLRLNYAFLVAVVIATIVVVYFPAEDALLRFPIVSLVVLLILLLHVYAVRSGSRQLSFWVENLVFISGAIMWIMVWFNGEVATILLPGFVAFVGVFGFARFWPLVYYSVGSVAVLLVALIVLRLDPAVVGRSLVTLIAVIGLLFFLRGYIQLLDRSEGKLKTLDITLRSVLSQAKINVFDLRPSTGEGQFLYAYDSKNLEFIDQSRWLEMIEPKYRSDVLSNLMQLGMPTEFRVNLQGSDSSPSWHWLREEMIHEYVDESGELHRIGYSQNIDDEVAVREQLLASLQIQKDEKAKLAVEIEKFDSVCDQLELVFWRLSLADGTITYNNQFARRWNLESGGSISFQQLKSFMHPEYADFHDHCIQQTLKQQSTLVTTYQAPLGPREGRWFELRYWPDYDNHENMVAVNVSNTDITDLMEVQSELRLKHAESVVQQRREKDMYSVIAHEMRTPAAILKMQLEQERRGLGQIDRKLFETSVDQLLSVVDMLRTVSQPEEMVSRELSAALPCELLANQIAILKALAQEEGMELITHCDSVTDRPLMLMQGPLKQLISNLVKNALLHSQGSQVILSADCEEIEGGFFDLTLYVDDDGRGIPATEIDRLFEPYERGEGSINGTGLGLFVCRQIANIMGATLSYADSPHGGARFVLNWKAAIVSESTNAELAVYPATDQALAELSVLLVEDDPGILQMTAVLLSDECSVLRIAKDGQQALDILAKSQVDLVLTDIFMPQMNGIELVTVAREQGYNQPIIGLTAATLGRETESLLQAGANAVMNKPVRIEELKKRVGELVAKGANSVQ